MVRRWGTAIAVIALLVAAGCSNDNEPNPEPSKSSSDTPTASPPETAPTIPPLDWQPTGHSVDKRVIVGAKWSAVSSIDDVRFERTTGDAEDVVLPRVGSGSVNAVLLEGDTAVVSYSFGGETTVGLGYRVDLTTGEQTEIVTPQPANGGDWSMVDDSLYFPALDEGENACLATLAVSDANGEEGWCPPGRVGIAELEANDHGVAAMLFDYDSDISCRTLTLLDQVGVPQPVDGPAECKGWDIAATSTGIIWSEIPRPKRQEVAAFHAILDGAPKKLAMGTTGTLTSCGDDAFFVSDPLKTSDPARLMRWDGTTLSVAYESDSLGNAFIAKPECADDIISISSFGEDGDEQVSARVA